jgi:hypothetical protein
MVTQQFTNIEPGSGKTLKVFLNLEGFNALNNAVPHLDHTV